MHNNCTKNNGANSQFAPVHHKIQTLRSAKPVYIMVPAQGSPLSETTSPAPPLPCPHRVRDTPCINHRSPLTVQACRRMTSNESYNEMLAVQAKLSGFYLCLTYSVISTLVHAIYHHCNSSCCHSFLPFQLPLHLCHPS